MFNSLPAPPETTAACLLAPGQPAVPQADPQRTALLIVLLSSFCKSQQSRNIKTFTGHCTGAFCHILVLSLYTYSTACGKPLPGPGNLHPRAGHPKTELLPRGCRVTRAHSGQFNQCSALSLLGTAGGDATRCSAVCSPWSLWGVLQDRHNPRDAPEGAGASATAFPPSCSSCLSGSHSSRPPCRRTA